MNTTPASLLERLRQPSDRAAWARFVELYTPLLYYWARRVGLREADASDLVQEVFVLLWVKLPEFRYDPGKGFRGWLRTVTLNKWRERLRKDQARPDAGARPLPDVPGPGALDVWETEYHQHVLRKAMELMQNEFEATTWKACWEIVACDRSAAEVAAELGLSVGAVRAAKFRVLARLRQELEGLLD
jgi:RNA polymerase sigma-70 factor (ECF subfamily)